MRRLTAFVLLGETGCVHYHLKDRRLPRSVACLTVTLMVYISPSRLSTQYYFISLLYMLYSTRGPSTESKPSQGVEVYERLARLMGLNHAKMMLRRTSSLELAIGRFIIRLLLCGRVGPA